jgi:cell division protein FtsA
VQASRFATVVGLAQYGAHRVALGGATSGVRRGQAGGVDKIASRVKTWLQDFF